MKKILFVLVILIISISLLGCTETGETNTANDNTNQDDPLEPIESLDELDERLDEVLGEDRGPTPEVIDLSACNLLSLEESNAKLAIEGSTIPNDKLKSAGCNFFNNNLKYNTDELSNYPNFTLSIQYFPETTVTPGSIPESMYTSREDIGSEIYEMKQLKYLAYFSNVGTGHYAITLGQGAGGDPFDDELRNTLFLKVIENYNQNKHQIPEKKVAQTLSTLVGLDYLSQKGFTNPIISDQINHDDPTQIKHEQYHFGSDLILSINDIEDVLYKKSTYERNLAPEYGPDAYLTDDYLIELVKNYGDKQVAIIGRDIEVLGPIAKELFPKFN